MVYFNYSYILINYGFENKDQYISKANYIYMILHFLIAKNQIYFNNLYKLDKLDLFYLYFYLRK